MKEVLLALLMSAVALAGHRTLPTAAGLNKPAPHSADKPVGKFATRRSPFRFIRRLGEMEVNLDVRISSVGICDSEINGKPGPVLKQPEGASDVYLPSG